MGFMNSAVSFQALVVNRVDAHAEIDLLHVIRIKTPRGDCHIYKNKACGTDRH